MSSDRGWLNEGGINHREGEAPAEPQASIRPDTEGAARREPRPPVSIESSRTFLRRDVLKSLAALVPLATVSTSAQQDATPRGLALFRFLESLRTPDGGYGWGDGTLSHLTPTFGAVGCYHLLGQKPPEPIVLARYVRTHHPFALKKLEREMHCFEYQQICALQWLGENPGDFRQQVSSWTKPFAYAKQYEKHGFPIFEYEMMAFVCRQLLGMPLDDFSADFLAYLDSRRRDDGSFNNTPASDGSGGHVLNTWWGLRALDALGRKEEQHDETVQWLQACRRDDGGFTWQPDPAFAGNTDVAYTWAAVRSLELLGASPKETDACIASLMRLRTVEGGFAPREGWDSNPIASYYVLDALRALGALDALNEGSLAQHNARRRLSPDLKVFTIQLEAHGKGSPAEAVDLARALKIDLWGAKNASPAWLAAARNVAKAQNVPVTFFTANEEYGTWVSVPGMGTYSHTSDVIAPAGADIGESLAGGPDVTWEEFRERRLKPLQHGGGCLVWQFGENEPLTRLFLDDSLARSGFAAISSFHFGNPDFTNSEPFLKQYRNQIPYVGLQDAHGDEPWWFADQLEGFRTLFLANEPTWDAWLDALTENRVAAVRRDAVSGGETWMHGRPDVLEAILQQKDRWQWWDNPHVMRPKVSIVALTPQSQFEVARPEKGIALRMRLQWSNTTQGKPKTPKVELVRLLLDGKEVPTQHVTPGPQNRPLDDYFLYQTEELAPGEHVATVIVRDLETREELRRELIFAIRED